MDSIEQQLAQRLGRIHAKQRLGIESEGGQRIFGKGYNFFHPENWYSIHSFIKACIKLSGLYARGQRNARNIQVKTNLINCAKLPQEFNGFTLLQLSDLHVDMDNTGTSILAELITTLQYDVCVLTGDYRAQTFGEYDSAIAGMRRIINNINSPCYAVLGNHDSVRMVPALETMGIRMLLNESVQIVRAGAAIYLAGIDDAHYFRVDNIEKAAGEISSDAFSILLSHTPEIYRLAAHAGFDAIFCGHTHGGQICLPGGIPITLDSRCPRYMGAGAWRYHNLQGYTSVGSGTSIVNVRFNCLPEVTLHRLLKEA